MEPNTQSSPTQISPRPLWDAIRGTSVALFSVVQAEANKLRQENKKLKQASELEKALLEATTALDRLARILETGEAEPPRTATLDELAVAEGGDE